MRRKILMSIIVLAVVGIFIANSWLSRQVEDLDNLKAIKNRANLSENEELKAKKSDKNGTFSDVKAIIADFDDKKGEEEKKIIYEIHVDEPVLLQ